MNNKFKLLKIFLSPREEDLARRIKKKKKKK